MPPQPYSEGADPSLSLSVNLRSVVQRAVGLARARGAAPISALDLNAACLSQIVDDGGTVMTTVRPTHVTVITGDVSRHEHQRPHSILTEVGTDLVEQARQGVLVDVVGRDSDIGSAMETLLLLECANPLLVGEAGVGKTAVVHGLAQRIANRQCDERLKDTRLIEIDAGRLVTDPRFRGDFKRRLQDLVFEARGNVILFFDELHAIVGAGGGESGGLDSGGAILKAALARADLRLIGTTTPGEYRQTIGRDKALSHRFQVQTILPTSREATIRVLSARQTTLERHHGVRILEDAKVAAVDLSGRYLLDRHWPAKARDVLERSCLVQAASLARPPRKWRSRRRTWRKSCRA